MKKFLLSLLLVFYAYAGNMYFNAFLNIQKAKRLQNTNPKQAQRLFIEAYGYLKQIVNNSINENRPSANALNLLGKLYLNGWGVEKNENKAVKLLCAAAKYGNMQAKNTLKKLNAKCKPINIKELKQ